MAAESVRKRQAAGFDIARDQGFEPGLEDRDHSPAQLPDLRRIPVDAGHDMSEIGKAGPGHEPHVTGTDHRYSHGNLR
jgi:hypothetical protein